MKQSSRVESSHDRVSTFRKRSREQLADTSESFEPGLYFVIGKAGLKAIADKFEDKPDLGWVVKLTANSATSVEPLEGLDISPKFISPFLQLANEARAHKRRGLLFAALLNRAPHEIEGIEISKARHNKLQPSGRSVNSIFSLDRHPSPLSSASADNVVLSCKTAKRRTSRFAKSDV